MKHQHPPAEAVGAHLESGAVGGERIPAALPVVSGRGACLDEYLLMSVRRFIEDVALVVVENHLEHPVNSVDLVLRQKSRPMSRNEQRRGVAIADALDVSVGLASLVLFVSTIGFVSLGEIEVLTIFGLVLVADGVALVVTRFTDQPAEDPGWIDRVCNPRSLILTVKGEDVIFGNGAPVHIFRIGFVCPPFNAGK